ncbi:MAG: recombinase family protein [Dehalococcoides mccartyi]|uniref:recombinase family protein n=1 Tax=Dehalococcoides TaxID=61434 RepID=UPI0019ED69D6|nr:MULTISPECIES: recombinase family protein [Dehalococcoides]MBF4482283.1 recombinase family protein [Dehalococcoides mccartyi]MBJ7531858.1 recombinase family protein [Dehalococcoides mccartyi]MDP4279269.1 recombinase family protein [Dehalococcoides mccartyi]
MEVSRNVTVIPARKHTRKNNDEEKPKLRVAAYCRVSTDSEEQATSYDAQIEHYTNYINGHPDWELGGIFADDGISGTNTKKREEFNRLIDECMAGNIDMVITKSISRFARNTLDCLKYIRQLKDKNIAVYFEKENINSMDSKGEVMLTIMASLAQQESQSLSQNVKLGLQYRYQQGEIQVNCKWFLGYTKDENKKLVVVPEEAKVIKRIYREYLEGASMLKIARGLEADSIKNGAGREKWHTSNINQILRNEKYIGDALLQKTYTVDFLSKKRVKNNGIVPQYYVENSHEAIIPREIFMQVQEELIRRRCVHLSKNGNKRSFSSTHCFANIIICGNCGEIFRRVHWNNRGKKSIVWRCVSRLENTGLFCDARTVLESTIEQVLVTAINNTLSGKNTFLATLQNNIESVLTQGDDKTLAEIDKRLADLQTQLLKLATTKADYEDVAEEIYQLREQKQKILVENANRDELRKRIADMSSFLQEQPTAITEYDESLVRRLIEKVTVFEDKFTVEFKSGMTVDVEE